MGDAYFKIEKGKNQSCSIKKIASSGNRTRAARVAGEHSTTEPTMLTGYSVRKILIKREKNRISVYKLSSLFYTKWNFYYNYVLKVNVMNDCTVMLVLLFYTV